MDAQPVFLSKVLDDSDSPFSGYAPRPFYQTVSLTFLWTKIMCRLRLFDKIIFPHSSHAALFSCEFPDILFK